MSGKSIRLRDIIPDKGSLQGGFIGPHQQRTMVPGPVTLVNRRFLEVNCDLGTSNYAPGRAVGRVLTPTKGGMENSCLRLEKTAKLRNLSLTRIPLLGPTLQHGNRLQTP